MLFGCSQLALKPVFELKNLPCFNRYLTHCILYRLQFIITTVKRGNVEIDELEITVVIEALQRVSKNTNSLFHNCKGVLLEVLSISVWFF